MTGPKNWAIEDLTARGKRATQTMLNRSGSSTLVVCLADHGRPWLSPSRRSPYSYAPETCAQAANLACGHHIPIYRATLLLCQLAGIAVSTGWMAGIRAKAAGGCWRTLQGLAAFALVQSYLSTASKWGISKLDALRDLFHGRAWIPPGLEPSG